jgi:hypothetical protein
MVQSIKPWLVVQCLRTDCFSAPRFDNWRTPFLGGESVGKARGIGEGRAIKEHHTRL